MHDHCLASDQTGVCMGQVTYNAINARNAFIGVYAGGKLVVNPLDNRTILAISL